MGGQRPRSSPGHKGGGQWGRGPGLDWSALEGCPEEEAEVPIRRISGDWMEGPWSVRELRLDCVTMVAGEGRLRWCWAAGKGLSVIVGFVEQGWIPASEPRCGGLKSALLSQGRGPTGQWAAKQHHRGPQRRWAWRTLSPALTPRDFLLTLTCSSSSPTPQGRLGRSGRV